MNKFINSIPYILNYLQAQQLHIQESILDLELTPSDRLSFKEVKRDDYGVTGLKMPDFGIKPENLKPWLKTQRIQLAACSCGTALSIADNLKEVAQTFDK